MDKRAVRRKRDFEYKPPFCPRKKCRNHIKKNQKKEWYVIFSSFFDSDKREKPRFMCNVCYKTFSYRTFKADYYLKRDISYQYMFSALERGMNLNVWAKVLRVHPHSLKIRLIRLLHQYTADKEIKRSFHPEAKQLLLLYRESEGSLGAYEVIQMAHLLKKVWSVRGRLELPNRSRFFFSHLTCDIDDASNWKWGVTLWGSFFWHYCFYGTILKSSAFYIPAFIFH